MSIPPHRRVGRFAPSPTGPLHFGSLVAAVGSALEARCDGGRWLVRIEDIDLPRTQSGADRAILRELERLGFVWDEQPVWQSERAELYRAALNQLSAADRTYGCACSRREIADSAPATGGAHRYPGTCRGGLPPGRVARSTRLRVDAGQADVVIHFADGVQGEIVQNVECEIGDFVLDRADGQIAYQLAVVVDDAAQGVTQVVRGADLLDSTARQILLQRMLGLPTPSYAHLPVALDGNGDKLSKQTLARPIDTLPAAQLLCATLEFLGQAPPAALQHESQSAVWAWAARHWSLSRVPCIRALPAPVLCC
ncbi:MAG: tRNA glutamyl-Q(34) synthetase GluQRS [Sterolibacteriaceae bacterium]|nr:tRNA glutamyl-Q(34) synthetase GluQRS [Sterolibacteriaceae bacterium]